MREGILKHALRRTWIPKRGSPERRPLGIPTQHERARQTLVRQALEPEWEATLAPHTYGFRPGRSCWDAIAAVFHRIKFPHSIGFSGKRIVSYGEGRSTLDLPLIHEVQSQDQP